VLEGKVRTVNKKNHPETAPDVNSILMEITGCLDNTRSQRAELFLMISKTIKNNANVRNLY